MLMKRRNENTPQDTSDKVLYEQVHSPSPSITMLFCNFDTSNKHIIMYTLYVDIYIYIYT